MVPRPLVPVDRLDEADWLVAAITEFTGDVAQLMPPGFQRCVRVFHRPDQGLPREDTPASWAEVARTHGTVMHAEAQWDALTGGEETSGLPVPGSLDPLSLGRLSRILREHTTTPDRCHFSLWLGHGRAPSAWDGKPHFELPGRSHWLFAPVPVLDVPACSVELAVAGLEEQSRLPGGIPGLITFGGGTHEEHSRDLVRRMREAGEVQSPSWWWPEDRAWVVHTEVDYDSTLVAGSLALRTALVDDPELECWQVEPSMSLMANADRVNDRWA